jgi:predicted amidohydrolase
MVFKLALIQMVVAGGEKQKNLARAQAMIADASAAGADVVLLPEALDLGWTDPSSKTEAEPVPGGMPYETLASAAAEHGVFVCAGLTEAEDTRVYNSAVLIDRCGNLLSKHRKLNELEIGHEFYDQGDRLSVVHTEFGSLGLMICADGFAKDRVLSRSLCYMGADMILSPSAWAVPSDHDNVKEPYGDTWRNAYIPVAKEFAVWIAGVSNVGPITAGPWSGRKCIGCSLVVGPNGEEVLQGPYGAGAEKILYVDVQLAKRPARGCGWEERNQ